MAEEESVIKQLREFEFSQERRLEAARKKLEKKLVKAKSDEEEQLQAKITELKREKEAVLEEERTRALEDAVKIRKKIESYTTELEQLSNKNFGKTVDVLLSNLLSD